MPRLGPPPPASEDDRLLEAIAEIIQMLSDAGHKTEVFNLPPADWSAGKAAKRRILATLASHIERR